MMLSKFFIMVGLVALCGQAYAAPIASKRASLFGIEIGAPITLPKCVQPSIGVLDYRSNDTLCAEYDSPSVLQSGALLVIFARDGVPPYVPSGDLNVTTRDGVVAKVQAFTDGISSQALVYADLAKKYGKPYSLRRVKQSNMMGASFVVIFANWKTGAGDQITLLGAVGDFTSGMVTVMSSSAAAQEAADLKAQSGPAL